MMKEDEGEEEEQRRERRYIREKGECRKYNDS